MSRWGQILTVDVLTVNYNLNSRITIAWCCQATVHGRKQISASSGNTFIRKQREQNIIRKVKKS